MLLPISWPPALPRRYTHGVGIDLAEASRLRRPADGRMFRQRYLRSIPERSQMVSKRTFPDPAILSVISSDQDNEVVANRIVSV